MIFGFNTDVHCGNTVYHVQSEASQSTLLLQTTVFLQGRCVGKYSSSYAERAKQSDFSEQQMHELLKEQHRRVLEAVRDGNLALLSQSLGPPR